MSPVLYTGGEPGGQLTTTNDVENFPGYPDGINGPEMMMQFQAQAERFETDVRFGMATNVDFSGYPHKVVIDDNHEITTGAVIIATGASAQYLGLDSETRLNGKGVSACAICDGFFYKGMNVAVVGGGDSAVEAALALSEQPDTEVRLSYRGDAFSRIKPANHERIQASMAAQGGVEVMWSSSPQAIHPTQVSMSMGGQSLDVPASQIFVFIGGELPTGFLRECGVEIETHFGAP